jgi:hypothetical protein
LPLRKISLFLCKEWRKKTDPHFNHG